LRVEPGMARFNLERGESALTILCPKDMKRVAGHSLETHRLQLVSYIRANPGFQTTFEPWVCNVDEEVPIVRRMCRAAEVTGTGPMAAVAGTIAQLVVEDLVSAGAPYAMADNGGDIYARCPSGVTVGIYNGRRKKAGLAMEMPPRAGGWSVCTSSGTIGPSISLGCSDAAVVVGTNASVCDAAATAMGNRVRGEDGLESCFDFLFGIKAVEGAIVMVGEKIATWGELPELRRAIIPEDKITRGQTNC